MATTTKKTTKKSKTTKAGKSTTVKKTAPKRSVSAATTKSKTSKKGTAKVTKASTPEVATTAVVTTSSTDNKKAPKEKKKSIFTTLNKWNWFMAALHALQGAAVLYLSRNVEALFPVTTTYITADTLTTSGDGAPILVSAMRSLADVNLAYVVAAFFFMSAIAHIVIASVYRNRYETNLKLGINKARWYEYSLSASTMMLGIAMLSGVTDLSTLIMIFGATAVMNLLGLVMEVHNQTTEKTSWISFVIGTIAGLLPWVTIGVYFWGANQYGSGDIPTFVYYIYLSIFAFFSSFAVNMYLQYKGKGKWSDYLYGEKAYMILSLVAKSALAWQVFAGTLRP